MAAENQSPPAHQNVAQGDVADVVSFFLGPDDEVAFFRHLEPLRLTLYPELFDPNTPPLLVNATTAKALEASSYYLAAEDVGPVEVYPVKRGPNRGLFAIDEVRSPVIHYERSLRLDDALVAGRVWAELVVSQNTEANVGKSEAFRQLFVKVRDQLKRLQRSQPVGVFVGPQAARLFRSGLKLRGAGRHGKLYQPFR